MNKLFRTRVFRTLVAALALSAAASSHAAVIGFDTGAEIAIDNDTNLATYSEAGFSLTGMAASFLTIDGIGSGASGGLFLAQGNTLSLTAQDGGLFRFTGLDAGLFGADLAALLDVTGIFADSTSVGATRTLAELTSEGFVGFDGLSELRISATADLVLDNLLAEASPVPEPGTVAMLLLGLGALTGARRAAGKRAV